MTHFKSLQLAAPAKKDLQLIAEYTKREWGNVQKDKYLRVIQQTFRALAFSEITGRPRDDIAAGIYYYSIEKHLIFYRETKQELIILRILHQRMDVHKHLKR